MRISISPTTRLSSTEVVDGCTICTRSPLPTENDCQLMAALSVPCTICVWPGAGVDMPACPCTTTPPCGPASAGTPASARHAARQTGRMRNGIGDGRRRGMAIFQKSLVSCR